MTGREFMEYMRNGGREELRREIEKKRKEAEEAEDRYYDELGALVEKHPIGAVYAHQLRTRSPR